MGTVPDVTQESHVGNDIGHYCIPPCHIAYTLDTPGGGNRDPKIENPIIFRIFMPKNKLWKTI